MSARVKANRHTKEILYKVLNRCVYLFISTHARTHTPTQYIYILSTFLNNNKTILDDY